MKEKKRNIIITLLLTHFSYLVKFTGISQKSIFPCKQIFALMVYMNEKKKNVMNNFLLSFIFFIG